MIGLAGWADQDVFIKELDGALASIGTVLPIKERTLRLINNRETVSSVPLASPRRISQPQFTPSAARWTKTRTCY